MYDYQPAFLTGASADGSFLGTANQKATPNFLSAEEVEATRDFSANETQKNSTSTGKVRDFVADSGKIEDTLIAKQKLYDEKLEDQREAKLAKEGLQQKPKITSMAKQIQRDTHIVKRLFSREKERMELWDYKLQKDAIDEAKATAHWFSPQVNKTSEMIRARSTTGSRFSKEGLKRQLDEYNEKVQERERLHRERLREQVEVEVDMAVNAGKPKVSSRSTKLMTQRNARDNTENLEHHERMAHRDEARMKKKLDSGLAAEAPSFTPKITPYASSLYNNTNVQERMEMDVQAYQMSRGINNGTRGGFDISVSNAEATRRAAARSYGAKSQGAGQVRDSVYERTMAKQKQRDLNIASARLEEERNLYSPSINANSAAMTAHRQSMLGQGGGGGQRGSNGSGMNSVRNASDLLRGRTQNKNAVGDVPTYLIRQQQFEDRRQTRMDELKQRLDETAGR